jgi:hypothetical protein
MQSTKINLNGVGIYVSGLPVYSIKPSDLSSCLKSCTSSACVFLSLVIQCQSQLITFSRRPPPSTLQLEGFIVYTHLFPPFFIISFFKIKFFGVPDKERSESNFSPSAKKIGPTVRLKLPIHRDSMTTLFVILKEAGLKQAFILKVQVR